MADEPQTHTVSEFVLDFGAAIGWGMAYPILFAGFFLISNHVKSLLTGIPFISGVETTLFLPFLPTSLWLQTPIVLAIGSVLMGIAAGLYPPCARRLLDRKLMQVNDDLIWY
jgi:hypothetical protein